MNHSIYLGSLLCFTIFLNKKEAGTLLCYISMKKRQSISSSPKNIRFYRFRLKKIHDELTRHAAVRMNLSILIADDEITRLDIKLSKQIFLVMVFETGHNCLAN